MAEKIITPDVAAALKEGFKRLDKEVAIHVFTRKGANDQFNDITVRLVKELAEFDKKIRPVFHEDPNDPAWIKYGVERSPTLLLDPERYRIRYTGAPIGEESRTFILAIIMASTGKSFMDKDLLARLGELKKPRSVKIFVSPTCPYCPQEALYAISAAIDRPEFVSTEVIETYENQDLAERYAAMSVPKTYIDEELTASHLEAEDEFIENLLAGGPAVFAARPEEAKEADILIVGGGPGGLTAAIYAGRSGLNTIILEKGNVGGQVTITPFVENYPGFSNVGGKTLVDMMFTQAAQYARIKQGVAVKDVRRADDAFECTTTGGVFRAKAIIIATGATYRKLGAPGEDRLAGRGISYCATCDGYLFKDGKTVVVIGGGNTAVTDALYLDGLGAHVTLIHRGDTLRAEERLKQSIFRRDLPVLWNSRVAEFEGEKRLEKVKIEGVKDGSKKEIKVDGAFIAIGYEPESELAKMMGLVLDGNGYIKVNERQETSVPFVYAAGDVTGGEKQITVAVSQGTIAAISAFQDLTKAALVK